ncbi:unnamed protein product, partial [Closterium sp. NIES-54]
MSSPLVEFPSRTPSAPPAFAPAFPLGYHPRPPRALEPTNDFLALFQQRAKAAETAALREKELLEAAAENGSSCDDDDWPEWSPTAVDDGDCDDASQEDDGSSHSRSSGSSGSSRIIGSSSSSCSDDDGPHHIRHLQSENCEDHRGNGTDPERQNKQRLARRASRDRWNLQQLLIAERRALGPSVAGSYFYQREDAEGKKPLFSFGVMTDVQYADIDDGHSFLGIPRFYRHSLEVVKRAVRDWNHETNHISFAVHFGDLVDGLCPREKSLEAFQTVLGEFGKLTNGPVYHMLGNHCLYNLPRKTLNKLLAMPPSADHRSYYHFSPFPGFRLVVLDPYDISMIGWPSGHPHAELAAEILGRQNPNEEKNSPEGMVGMQRRFLKFNGGVSETQLGWLEGVLRESDECGETVIICCHLPVEPNALPTSTCLIWNYDKVLATIQQHDCAVAVISGHAHFGAYTCDDKGIHHRILEA